MSESANPIKMSVWAALFISIACQAEAQLDPLATDIFALPEDTRRTSSLEEKVYIDPNADPLGIDALMRPIDTQHTSEYLEKLSSGSPSSPAVATDLGGNWTLNLSGGTVGSAYLHLVQNMDAVFGRGTLASSTAGKASVFRATSATGYMAKDVLHLDLLDTHNLILYRCTLTAGRDSLLGSFSAYDASGQRWSGTAQGRRVI